MNNNNNKNKNNKNNDNKNVKNNDNKNVKNNNGGRHDFTIPTKTYLKLNCGYICGNPTCRKLLWSREGFVGRVAHIIGAAENGPRASKTHASDKIIITDNENGLILCPACEVIIDKNEQAYPIDVLKKWKDDTEALFREFVAIYTTSEAHIPTTIYRDNPKTIQLYEKRIRALEDLANVYKKNITMLQKKNQEQDNIIIHLNQQLDQIAQNEQLEITSLDHQLTELTQQYQTSTLQYNRSTFALSLMYRLLLFIYCIHLHCDLMS